MFWLYDFLQTRVTPPYDWHNANELILEILGKWLIMISNKHKYKRMLCAIFSHALYNMPVADGSYPMFR